MTASDTPTLTVRAAIAHAVTRLGPEAESARIDAEILLAHSSGLDRSALYAWPERALEPRTIVAFNEAVERRAAGYPIAYLTGTREFWSLALQISPVALIPRPETEHVVEVALRLAGDGACMVADLGTGCGAIAIALASERPDWTVLATDVSDAACELARTNAARLGVANVVVANVAWCDALVEGGFDLIACNPPYLASGDAHLGKGDLRFEPRAALTAGPEGLAALRTITANAIRCLRPGGHLVLEHGFEQGPAVRALFSSAHYVAIETTRDYAGHERVTAGARRL